MSPRMGLTLPSLLLSLSDSTERSCAYFRSHDLPLWHWLSSHTISSHLPWPQISRAPGERPMDGRAMASTMVKDLRIFSLTLGDTYMLRIDALQNSLHSRWEKSTRQQPQDTRVPKTSFSHQAQGTGNGNPAPAQGHMKTKSCVKSIKTSSLGRQYLWKRLRNVFQKTGISVQNRTETIPFSQNRNQKLQRRGKRDFFFFLKTTENFFVLRDGRKKEWFPVSLGPLKIAVRDEKRK